MQMIFKKIQFRERGGNKSRPRRDRAASAPYRRDILLSMHFAAQLREQIKTLWPYRGGRHVYASALVCVTRKNYLGDRTRRNYVRAVISRSCSYFTLDLRPYNGAR